MFLVLLPFPTSILGSAPENPVAVAFYGLMMIPIGIAISATRWYATIHSDLADPAISKSLYRAAFKKGFSSPLLYLVAASAGYFIPVLGVILYICIAIYYFLPTSLDKKATQH